MAGTAYRLGSNVPDAHQGNLAPDASRAIDLDGDEFTATGAPAGVVYVPSFRAGRSFQAGHGPSVDSTRETLAAEHLSRGKAHARQNEIALQGNQWGPDDAGLVPIPEHQENGAFGIAPVQQVEGPPSQYRAGSTYQDNTRPSRMPAAQTRTERAFDQASTQEFDPMGRASLPQPFAARTLQYADDAPLAYPNASGGARTVGSGGGVGVGLQPNTVRVMPNAWDELAINTGGPLSQGGNVDVAQQAVASQAVAGWRAR